MRNPTGTHHDPLRPRPLPRKPDETIEEAEDRVRQELRGLVADKRNSKTNDPEFRNYVRRQHERIFNDPTGRRVGAVVGAPSVFATDLERFDRARERNLMAASKPEVNKPKTGFEPSLKTHISDEVAGSVSPLLRPSGSPRKGGLSSTSFAISGTRQATRPIRQSNQIPQPFDRASQAFERPPGENRPVLDRLIPQSFRLAHETALAIQDSTSREDALDGLEGARLFFESWERKNWWSAYRALDHFLEGSGRPLEVDAHILHDFDLAQEAVEDVEGHFENWLMGRLEDSVVGNPTLEIQDGERLIVGGDGSGPTENLDDRVFWEAGLSGVGEGIVPDMNLEAIMSINDIFSEAQALFGGATVEGFGYFEMERFGNRVLISGFIDFRVTDVYGFNEGDWLNRGLRDLEPNGLAMSFDLSTPNWRRPFHAVISIENDVPSSIRSRLENDRIPQT